MTTDAGVIAHTRRDFLYIRADQLAEISQFIDKGDLCREKSVAGIFDHFRRAQVRDHNGCAQGQMQLCHLVGCVLVQGANHVTMGAHKIGDG